MKITEGTHVADDGTVYLWFFAPAKIWSTNAALHWAKVAELKRLWRQAGYVVARQGRISDLPGLWEVQLRLPFRQGRRRDPHNYTGTVVKSVIDGLVDAKVWPDDTPEYVHVRDSEFRKIKKDEPEIVMIRLFPLVVADG